MDAREDTRRIQVLSVPDTGRRRRWTDAEKIRIVGESLGDGVTLAEAARRHDVSRSQLYDWRYRHKHGLLGSGPDDVPAPPAPVLMTDLGPRCRVTIPSGFDMEAAAHLLNGLMVRS